MPIIVDEWCMVCDQCQSEKTWSYDKPTQEEYPEWKFDGDKTICPSCVEKNYRENH
jgi:hypothetical protein